MKLLIIIALGISNVFANLHLAPPSFVYKDSNAVFIDIEKGTYDIKYYPSSLSSQVKTTWTFKTIENGYPIFDFVPKKMGLKLNGEAVRFSNLTSPDGVTSYKVVNKMIKAGTHTLEIWTKIKRGIKFGLKTVNSGFFIKDLSEKKFLEKYIPANLEYDQYPITFNVKVFSKKRHKVIANGNVSENGWNDYTVNYPSYYSSSSIYFHVFEKGKYKWINSTLTSIDGRELPLTIYTKKLLNPTDFYIETKKVFAELEKDYGPWPHPRFIIYGMSLRGGMEYPGATATSLRSLGHEMYHSYFAKSVIPADGNSGWMDEGLATWRGNDYPTLNHPGFEMFNIGAHSVYKRNTDDNSYRVGNAFFSYLNSKINLKSTLRRYFEKYKASIVTTDMMINFFEKDTGVSLRGEFLQFVLNKKFSKEFRSDYVQINKTDNPHHPILTSQELENVL